LLPRWVDRKHDLGYNQVLKALGQQVMITFIDI